MPFTKKRRLHRWVHSEHFTIHDGGRIMLTVETQCRTGLIRSNLEKLSCVVCYIPAGPESQETTSCFDKYLNKTIPLYLWMCLYLHSPHCTHCFTSQALIKAPTIFFAISDQPCLAMHSMFAPCANPWWCVHFIFPFKKVRSLIRKLGIRFFPKQVLFPCM